MLRIAGRRLTSRIQASRPFVTSTINSAEEDDKGTKAFLEKFMPNVVGSAVEPQFVSDFVKKPTEQQEGVPDKLTLNFFLPHKQQVKDAKVTFKTSYTYIL